MNFIIAISAIVFTIFVSTKLDVWNGQNSAKTGRQSFLRDIYFVNENSRHVDQVETAYDSRLLQQTQLCTGYFCDKYVDSMVIVMTHNSLATPGNVTFPSQSRDLVTQFRDGVRGFNFDLYDNDDDGTLYTMHGPDIETSPVQSIDGLVQELRKVEHKNEFIFVQLQDQLTTSRGVTNVIELFGDLLITNFDVNLPFSYYIEKNKRVLLVTTKTTNVDIDRGIHNSNVLMTENSNDWTNCFHGRMPTSHRRGPSIDADGYRYARLMNSFCAPRGVGDPLYSSTVNDKVRLLFSARDYTTQSYSFGVVNIIMVDFYERGQVFEVQNILREVGPFEGCMEDGTTCSAGSTCWGCCGNIFLYWPSRADIACGIEACQPNDHYCFAGVTCGECCSGASCPWWRFGLCTCK